MDLKLKDVIKSKRNFTITLKDNDTQFEASMRIDLFDDDRKFVVDQLVKKLLNLINILEGE